MDKRAMNRMSPTVRQYHGLLVAWGSSNANAEALRATDIAINRLPDSERSVLIAYYRRDTPYTNTPRAARLLQQARMRVGDYIAGQEDARHRVEIV